MTAAGFGTADAVAASLRELGTLFLGADTPDDARWSILRLAAATPAWGRLWPLDAMFDKVACGFACAAASPAAAHELSGVLLRKLAGIMLTTGSAAAREMSYGVVATHVDIGMPRVVAALDGVLADAVEARGGGCGAGAGALIPLLLAAMKVSWAATHEFYAFLKLARDAPLLASLGCAMGLRLAKLAVCHLHNAEVWRATPKSVNAAAMTLLHLLGAPQLRDQWQLWRGILHTVAGWGPSVGAGGSGGSGGSADATGRLLEDWRFELAARANAALVARSSEPAVAGAPPPAAAVPAVLFAAPLAPEWCRDAAAPPGAACPFFDL